MRVPKEWIADSKAISEHITLEPEIEAHLNSPDTPAEQKAAMLEKIRLEYIAINQAIASGKAKRFTDEDWKEIDGVVPNHVHG